MWYVHKGLGTIIADSINEDSQSTTNLQVKLNFIPNNNKLSLDPSHELYNEEFHIYDRNNNCVVCSSSVNFSRCQIIPALYRSRFPHSMKSHSNHDVVLLCFPCQEKAQIYQHRIKKEIETQFGVPLVSLTDKQVLNNKI